MTRIKRAFVIGAWNTGFLLMGVLVVELVFGNWLHDDPLRYLHIVRNGSWHYEVSYPGIADEDRSVIYTRDRWGLRGDYGVPADIDILTVGGSTTDQRLITDGATWQAVMARRFQRDGLDIRIANAGINGRTTFGHLHDFDLWFPNIQGLDPSYVLLYIGLNDMFFERPNSRFDEPYRDRGSLKELVKANSVLYFFYRTSVGAWRAIERNLAYVTLDYTDAKWTDKPLLSGHGTRLEERLQDYEARVRSLLERIDAMGAVPVVVSQPRGDYRILDDGQVVGMAHTNPRITRSFRDSALGLLEAGTANGVDYYRILSLFNEVSLNVCRESGGICIDLANELRFEDGDFYDHAHTTPIGSRRIGEYLYLSLRDAIAGPAGT